MHLHPENSVYNRSNLVCIVCFYNKLIKYRRVDRDYLLDINNKFLLSSEKCRHCYKLFKYTSLSSNVHESISFF